MPISHLGKLWLSELLVFGTLPLLSRPSENYMVLRGAIAFWTFPRSPDGRNKKIKNKKKASSLSADCPTIPSSNWHLAYLGSPSPLLNCIQIPDAHAKSLKLKKKK